MSRKPAAGSLEAAALSLAQEVSGNPDDWERRRKALFSMQEAVDEAGKTVPARGEKAVFTAEVWRYLREPLKNTLNDLRSAIVKEACVLLEKLSTASGNSMAAFMRDMLNVMLHLMANGNSVIVGQVDSCMRHIIAHSRFPRQLKDVDYTVKNSRSKDLRESVGSYVLLMLETWPAASMDKEAGHLESVIELLLRDASSVARTDARASFGILMQHWPKRADRILQAADPRTAKSLREQHDIGEGGIAAAAAAAGSTTSMAAKSSSSSLASSTTNNHSSSSSHARGGLLGGGASRVAKAAGSGGMSRRGPSSAEALRASAENSENPGTSPMQHRHPKATGATSGTARGVTAKTKPTVSAPSGSLSTPSTPTSSSLLLSSKKNRRNGLVPHPAGSPAASSPGPGATAAAAALAKAGSPSPGGKSVGMRKRRPATSKAASTLPSSSPVTSRRGSGGSSSNRGSIAKSKRAAAAAAASATAASATAAAGARSLVVGGSNSNSNSNTTTPTGSSSSRTAVPLALARPGTAVSPSLLVSPEGFLAPGSSSKGKGARRTAAAAGAFAASRRGGSQDWGGGSVSGSVALSEGGTASLAEGDKVWLQGGTVRNAVVRYVGETQFATGVWVGVELAPDAVPPGLNDGTVNGVSYFKCPPACGVFAKPDMFELVEEEEDGNEEAAAIDDNGLIEAAAGSDEATRAGAELLRHHKLFANEALEALKGEMAMIPGLEGAVVSNQAVDADRVRLYLEALENAAEAREAAAARLRSQIQETANKYPSVFLPSFVDHVLGGGDDDGDESPGADKKQDGGEVVDGDDKEVAGVEESEAVDNADGAPAEAIARGVGEEEDSGDSGPAVGRRDDEVCEGRDEDVGHVGDGGDSAAVDAGVDAGEKEEAGNMPAEDEKDTNTGAEGKGNVLGMAGKFLRDVLHIPPGGKGAGGDASAVAQSSNAEEEQQQQEGDISGGGDVASPTPLEATVVDATSLTTPNAIAADSKGVDVEATPEKSDGGEAGDSGGVEGGVEGVSVEG